MTEQYNVAAVRHLRVGELLANRQEGDDAAYHCGIAGETAIKWALQQAGCAAQWTAAKVKPKKTPMNKHFASAGGVHELVDQCRVEIGMWASGRLAAPIHALVLDPSFAHRFKGWSIDIRYADSTLTPVAVADVERFLTDATDLVQGLVL